MGKTIRSAFPWGILALTVAAVAWAVSFGGLPPADFTMDNGTEVATVDPAKAEGNPERHVLDCLYEGLLRTEPLPGAKIDGPPNQNVPMHPAPAMAESYQVSEDGKTYTFKMRAGALWSDGSPVTADDFAWSWQRTLHPETGTRYGYQFFYIQGAEAYLAAEVKPGDPVEIELPDRRDPLQNFPRGTVLRGTLTAIEKPPEPQLAPDATKEEKEAQNRAWRSEWVYLAEVDGKPRKFCTLKSNKSAEQILNILPDFQKTVGIAAPNPQTFIVTLKEKTPYFPSLVAFYPLFAVNRKCVETHGDPDWTKPENIVTNGPFKLQFRRIRDRIRVVKNDRYWEADKVSLNVIDILALKSDTTALNMYLTDEIDWATSQPASLIPEIKARQGDEFRSAPMLTAYFYRVNTEKPGLEKKQVRQALNLAIDKQLICQFITQAGEVPAEVYVPPGLAGYANPPGPQRDPEKARQLLAAAGYPNGKGFPHVEILYNESPPTHKTIAEAIQQQWKQELNISAELRGLEWSSYLDAQNQQDYYVTRAGWIADYPDPNTFLDMWVTGGSQNHTGWSNKTYDKLIADAAQASDPQKRMELLQQAEAILLDELPILPIYHYVSKNLVKPRVQGFYPTAEDVHPLTHLKVGPRGMKAPATQEAP